MYHSKKKKPINMATGGLMNMPPFIKKSEEEKERVLLHMMLIHLKKLDKVYLQDY